MSTVATMVDQPRAVTRSGALEETYSRQAYRILHLGFVVAPVLAGGVLLAILSAISLPGMSTFVSEFLVIAGTWSREPWVAAVAATGIILAAAYGLRMYQRTMTGPVTDDTATHVTRDLDGRERSVLIPVIAYLLVFGFVPGPIIQLVEPTATATMQRMGISDPVAPARGEK